MLAYLFVLFAVAVRFMPHPWMFTPVAGALLFFGARGSRRQLWIPFVLLAVSDVVLTKVIYSYPFSWDHFASWVWYAGMLWLGIYLRDNPKPVRLVGTALAGSVSFFLLSNFATWACWNMYPKNLGGLMTAYAMGLPFFRNALAGDLFFTLVMFATPVAVHAVTHSFHKEGDHAAAA